MRQDGREEKKGIKFYVYEQQHQYVSVATIGKESTRYNIMAGWEAGEVYRQLYRQLYQQFHLWLYHRAAPTASY